MRYTLAFLLALGCSSGSDQTSPATGGASYPAQCHSFVNDTMCGYNTVCARMTNLITEAQREQYAADCEAGASLTLDCSRAVGISGSLDACKADFAALPCSLFDPMTGLPVPASCQGLFLIAQH